MIEDLIGRVFTTRNIAHLNHFTTASYAAHEALGEFYEAVIPATDALVESYIGQLGMIGPVTMATPEVSSIVAHLQDEADWIEANRNEIAHDSAAIGNLVDALVGVYLKALYKLERFK